MVDITNGKGQDTTDGHPDLRSHIHKIPFHQTDLNDLTAIWPRSNYCRPEIASLIHETLNTKDCSYGKNLGK